MTPEQIDLVEASLEQARPGLDAMAADFYRRLFAADPAVATLFAEDLERQRVKFLTGLEAIARAIRRHPDFLAPARELGVRHREYGVSAAHYDLAGPPLLAALASVLGDRWTPAVEDAWRRAYHLAAQTMMAAAADSSTAP